MRTFLVWSFVVLSLAALSAGMLPHSATAQPVITTRAEVGASFFQAPQTGADLLNSGTSIGADVGIQIFRGLDIVLGGSFDQFTLNDERYLFFNGIPSGGSARVEGGDYRLLNGTVAVRLSLPNSSVATPYAVVGAGLFHRDVESARIVDLGVVQQESDAETSTDFGYHFGLGVDFRINRTWSFFAEPRFTIVRTGTLTTRYVPVRIGFAVRPWGANPMPGEEEE